MQKVYALLVNIFDAAYFGQFQPQSEIFMDQLLQWIIHFKQASGNENLQEGALDQNSTIL